jgi:hypothetical protein
MTPLTHLDPPKKFRLTKYFDPLFLSTSRLLINSRLLEFDPPYNRKIETPGGHLRDVTADAHIKGDGDDDTPKY